MKHNGRTPRLLVGCFRYSYVEWPRSQALRPPRRPGEGPNSVSQSISRGKLSKVTPKEWFRAPYLMCVLVSLEQHQARDAPLPKSKTYVVRVRESCSSPWPVLSLSTRLLHLTNYRSLAFS